MLAIVTSHPIQYQAPLWRALAGAGVDFEVWFLTPHAVQPSPDREFGRTFAWDLDLLAGYPHRFLPVAPDWRLDRFGGIRLLRDWDDELRERNVTTLWIEGWRFRTLWQAAFAADRLGIPLWLRGESHDLAPESWPRQLVKRVALGWLFQRVERFLCIGNERFAAAARELAPRRAELRQKWEIPDEAYCVLFCGKLIAKKRPLDLAAAAALCPRPAGRPLHLLFAGDGELRDALQGALSSAGVPATLAGFMNLSEIPGAFAVADCLVLPSDYGETWGLVVNEALASGVPAIVSDRCGCAEDLAAPQGAAHVFPGGDVAALADCLNRVARQAPPNAILAALDAAHSPQRTVETVITALNAAAAG